MDLNTHTDNLECLSDVHIASKKQFLIEGDRPQLINWERYGLRIGVSEGSLSSTETAEVAVVALVGGDFKFPKDTVLVSAVYAISVSRRLLKPLRLEMQHCVSITREDQTKYLKFAIAPVDAPSLSYQFTIVEGGEFRVGNHYGTIDHKEFFLVCIEAIFSNRDEKNYGEKGGPQLSGDMNDGDSSEKSEGRKGGGEGEKEESSSSDSDGSIVESKDSVHELQG